VTNATGFPPRAGSAQIQEWIDNSKLRREVTATTNIIESYNAFEKWLSFGGESVIAENDPDEQQMRTRYNDRSQLRASESTLRCNGGILCLSRLRAP
jgi:YD repeat-containing protein